MNCQKFCAYNGATGEIICTDRLWKLFKEIVKANRLDKKFYDIKPHWIFSFKGYDHLNKKLKANA